VVERVIHFWIFLSLYLVLLRNSQKFEVSSKASQGACVPPALPPLRTCNGQCITVQALCLKVGLGISRTNADLSGIQFATYFIDFFVEETKRFVSSTVNVISTRQTCGQRSSRAGESKRQALGNYFSKRIFYMFLKSKCRGN